MSGPTIRIAADIRPGMMLAGRFGYTVSVGHHAIHTSGSAGPYFHCKIENELGNTLYAGRLSYRQLVGMTVVAPGWFDEAAQDTPGNSTRDDRIRQAQEPLCPSSGSAQGQITRRQVG